MVARLDLYAFWKRYEASERKPETGGASSLFLDGLMTNVDEKSLFACVKS